MQKMILSVLLSVSVLASTLAIPATSMATHSIPTQATSVVTQHSVSVDGTVSPQWKVKVTSALLKEAAKQIRKGSGLFEEALGELSPTAAKAFRNHSSKVTDFLDKTAKKIDDAIGETIGFIKDELRKELKKQTRLSDGTIEEIIQAVGWLLWAVDFFIL